MNHPDDDTGAPEAPLNGGPVTVAMNPFAILYKERFTAAHAGR